DTGIGNKQHESFFRFFFLHGNDSLDKSLNKLGFNRNDITDVFLTHCHFDHCGGAIEKVADKYIPAFKNANYWSNKNHWNWAIKPNAREKASFLQENILPIEQSGQLKFINVPETGYLTNSPLGFDILFVDGHTDKQMIPHIKVGDKTLVFCADLLPSTGHIPLPYVMGYDTRPLITLTEKEKFLNNALQNNFILFLEHDYYNDCCTLTATEKGPRLNQKFDLSEIF